LGTPISGDRGAGVRMFGRITPRLPPSTGPALYRIKTMARLFTLHVEVVIRAPLERCFLLSTNVEIVQRELGMHPARGKTSGLVAGGDTILWMGWKLGLPQFHESLIDEFRPNRFFRDRMIAGRFRTFEHDHVFDPVAGGVRLHDDLRFTMRWGAFGDLLGRWVLVPHIRRLMRRRFELLKRIAESDEWRRYLPGLTDGGENVASAAKRSMH